MSLLIQWSVIRLYLNKQKLNASLFGSVAWYRCEKQAAKKTEHGFVSNFIFNGSLGMYAEKYNVWYFQLLFW